MSEVDYCSFLPSDNPYGIATISVGNDVRLNYEFNVLLASCRDAPLHYFRSSTIGQWSECITSGRMPTPAMRSFRLSVTMW